LGYPDYLHMFAAGRTFPAVVTRAVQRVLQRGLLGPLLRGEDPTPPAALLGVVERLPWLSVVPAYFVGVGVQPEHAGIRPSWTRQPHRLSPARLSE
jgi:hypothetical protein